MANCKAGKGERRIGPFLFMGERLHMNASSRLCLLGGFLDVDAFGDDENIRKPTIFLK